MYPRFEYRMSAFLLILSLGVGTTLTGAEQQPRSASLVEVRTGSDSAVIANRLLSLRTPIAADQMGSTVVEDLRTGAKITLEGDEFALEFEGGETIRSSDMQLIGVTGENDSSAGKLRFEFGRDNLRVRLVTELRTAQAWATRWLEIWVSDESNSVPRQLTAVSLARWPHKQASGPAAAGQTVQALGYPSGCGQAVYAGGFFFALADPGVENFATGGFISCRIPAADKLTTEPTRTRRIVLGAGSRRDFLRYIDATRAVKSRMIFLANDWYWKDKSRPLAAIEALARIKQQSGVPVDSFTLDDGWDFDWDAASGIWGRLNRRRFPGGWKALESAGRTADINISLWFGPIGGYSYRPKRIAFAREAGYEIQGDKLCLAAPRYRQHVIESFSQWAKLGMDYIKVDGFWPDCSQPDHNHVVGPAGAIDQMDKLIEVFSAWRLARPDLLIGYTSGSNPSPFWLQHADYVWRGGLDDSHAGAGEPFDRHNTYLDTCLERHRQTDMPISAFVTFDIVTDRIAGNHDEAFERGFWWLAARTSLHHDWYLQAGDLTLDRWRLLARAAKWARQHEGVFRWSRMVGGSPSKGEVYGFSAFDGRQGTLALRNPSSETQTIEATLSSLLELPEAERTLGIELNGVFGETTALDGKHSAADPLSLQLPPLAVAIFEVQRRP